MNTILTVYTILIFVIFAARHLAIAYVKGDLATLKRNFRSACKEAQSGYHKLLQILRKKKV